MSRTDLERIREWATAKLSAGREPPEACQPFVRVRDSVDAILARMNLGASPSEAPLRSRPSRNTHLVLAWTNNLQDADR
jgi:hypothetical protein